ncbi:MAG: PIN domain-containing protein [Bacteroidetes bacterium]|nr:PIN domain-containing protein [Bacteroidota bacterium]
MTKETKNTESKIFVDTDVIIDLLIDRLPFANSASKIFDLADKKKIKLCTSTLCINNVYYIVRKIHDDKKTRNVISDLLEIVDILNETKSDILNALESDFKDFEDATQHSVALSKKNINVILTRNTKDYKKSKIAVFTPETLMKMLLNEG